MRTGVGGRGGGRKGQREEGRFGKVARWVLAHSTWCFRAFIRARA